MKKLILRLHIIVIILFTSHFISFSQTYHQFPDSNAVWSVLEINYSYFPDSTKYNTVHYGLFGDTIINSTSYSKLFFNDGVIDSTILLTSLNTKYHGAIREEFSTKKIFFLPKDSIHEVLLYDFNINVADTVFIQSFYGLNYLICMAIDSIYINYQYRKSFVMWHMSLGWSRWLEGIGSTKGLLYDYYNLLILPKELLCFLDNNFLIYHLDSTSYPAVPYYDTIFYNGCHHNTTIITNKNILYFNKVVSLHPNPLTCSTLVSVSEHIKLSGISIDIFDSQGRRIKFIKNIKSHLITLYRNDFDMAGVYFVRLKSDKYIETIKLIVQ